MQGSTGEVCVFGRTLCLSAQCLPPKLLSRLLLPVPRLSRSFPVPPLVPFEAGSHWKCHPMH